MDGSSTVPASFTALLRLKNFTASTGVVLLACAGYHIAPSNRRLLAQLFGSPSFSFTGAQFVFAAASAYIALLALYYFAERDPCWTRFWQVALEFVRAPAARVQQGLVGDDRVAVLATLLKAFFGPLMTMALMTATMASITNATGIAQEGISIDTLGELLNRHGFALFMHLIIFVDVLIFTVGYLVELPSLRNQIRSVDPTLLGWAAALICYTPFNLVSITILGWQTTEYPQFDNPTTHVVMNFVVLILMAIYTAASVALGFKASNLTHRGVVTRGPYRFIRHPAYACKNVAWWIGSLPLMAAAFERSWFSGLQVVASVAGWTMIYILRAVTEEDHLRSVDGDYAAYAAKVRYRFVPGII